jgi:hypothetical protein
MDMKPGRQDFHSKPPSSNLTGLTRANDYWIARMDMKFDMQYLHGDLSGFNIYWLSPEPTQPDSLAGIWNPVGKTFIANHLVQTWQVLPEPMQPDSLAGIWNQLGKTFIANHLVQTWQVLQDPIQPDSLAMIWNQVGNTFAETCQVLIFIDCHQSLRNPTRLQGYEIP